MQSSISNLAKLSCIYLSKDEEPNYQAGIDSLLVLMEHIDLLDLSDTQPLYNPLDESATLAKDEIKEMPVVLELQKLTSCTKDNFYLVPRVL